MSIVLFVLGILFFIGGVIAAIVLKNGVSVIAILIGIVMVVMSCFASVPTGYTGIVTTFGRVQDGTLDAGFHLISPWQNVVTMDNREQRRSFSIQAFSADIQQVDVKGSVNFSIDKSTAMNLFRDVGTNYVDILVTPRLLEDVKAVFSHYSAENLVSKRNILSDEILTLMKEDMAGYGLNIIGVSVEDIDFTDAFTNAVEAKQVATQEFQKAQTLQQQQTMEAQQAAERKKIAAAAEADVAKIQADAEAYGIKTRADAEAEANSKISQSLTQSLIDYIQAQNWDGKLPTTMVGSSDAIPVLNVQQESKGE